uniref:3-ketoacyl-CoA reductase n=2 Tax=Sinocyclocheilus grahami TaxID=75366 RepID=A0A672LK06_SINGR
MESLQPVERALFWVGALITASLALWLLYKIITGFRIWVLGNGDLLSPKLGKWAVEVQAFFRSLLLVRCGFSLSLCIIKLYILQRKPRQRSFIRNHRCSKGLAILVFYFCLLVNNVGISYPYPEFFLHIPDLENFITNMINVNITSVCQMTRLVLPRMEARAKGVILNISSASGMFPVPLLTIYSSTKAFVDFFSLGLQAEYKCKGIIIQSVLPFFVATKMTRIRKPTLDKPTPERYVAAELTTVGLQDQTNGYFPHAVMGWVTTVVAPIKLVLYLGLRMNKAQRGGYLRRRKLR